MNPLPFNQRELEILQTVRWARTLCESGFVVLDTETTGRNPARDQAVSIALIDQDGNVLIDTLVKPTIPIESGATRIHGIAEADVQDAPGFAEIAPLLVAHTHEKPVVIYNASFDAPILHSSARAVGLQLPALRTRDAMLQFADYAGNWNEFFGNNSWWKLRDACAFLDVGEDIEDKLHSALGDARRTLALVKAMAAIDISELEKRDDDLSAS